MADGRGDAGGNAAEPADADREVWERRLAAAERRSRPLDGGGPLVVSGGGAVAVATDELLAYVAGLQRLADELALERRSLVRLQGDQHRLTDATARALVDEPGVRLRAALDAAVDGAHRQIAAVRRSSAVYAETESALTAAQQKLAGWIAASLGPSARVLLLVALNAAWTVPGVLLAWRLAPGGDARKLRGIQRFMQAHPELVTTPAFAAMVRGVAMNLDELAMSTAGVPPGIAAAIGDDRRGVTGVEQNGRGIMAAGGLIGLFKESPVAVSRVTEHAIADPPTGAAQRLRRVPEKNQVRIERYDAPGEPPRYVVYVAPTATFSPAPSSEPWDLTSNVGGVAGLSAGSFRATELAMRDAGIGRDAPVQFVGFSQGGLVASMLAGSGHWNSAGLETYGAPAANIPLPDDLPGMAVRNVEDFVPALAGQQLPTERLQIERRAFTDTLPTNMVAPAHQRDAYYATARAIDAAQSPEVRGQVAQLDAFTHGYTSQPGSTITVMSYHAVRT